MIDFRRFNDTCSHSSDALLLFPSIVVIISFSSFFSIRSTGNNECKTSLASRSASGIADI